MVFNHVEIIFERNFLLNYKTSNVLHYKRNWKFINFNNIRTNIKISLNRSIVYMKSKSKYLGKI